jgi:thiosulfate/3-mercaptopyruvate sulfurtransferase
LPGAVHADLVRDLSGPPLSDQGHHLLPSPARLAEVFGRLGIRRGEQVVAYDAAGGSLAAARLWWLLREAGHRAVAVLDGGWQAWRAAGGALAAGPVTVARSVFEIGTRPDRRVLLLADLRAGLRLLDARDPVRYRGEHEPINPRAGHIPGARNHFWRGNLDANGCFLPPDRLRAAMQTSLGTLPDGESVHYRGSGVSACHNVLAQVHAGFPAPRR